MWYPLRFPPEAQDRVEAAKIHAGQKFEQDKREARNSDVERLLRRLILRIFRVFVLEAKRLRVWRAAALDSQTREFLRQLTIELYFEKGFDNAGRSLATPVNHINGGLLSEVQREFERSPEWRYFEAARLAVATTPEPLRVEPQPAAAPAPPTAASEPAREAIQVSNTAVVYFASPPAGRAKKRRRKSARPRVDEPAASSLAQSAADKAATEPEPAVEAPQPPVTPSRSELIDLKIEEVERETARKINRKEFALIAGYTVCNLQLFQQGKATDDVDRAFNRALSYSAQTIVETLDKKTRS